ncbi:hypothetical protein CEE39_07120 [bacterium (candidate division B38) B3_B38]|nr:MAG: hypothetical protein CEE39_07120 [bacterium (candidate division B38) B3_B38]
MRRAIFNNLPLKLVSLALAFILWVLVMGGKRSIIEFKDVPLQFKNLPPAMSLTGDTVDAVNVRLRASDTILNTLSTGQIDISLDLSNVTHGEQYIPITFDKIRVPFGAEVIKVTPPTIRLLVERKLEKEIPIVPNFGGSLAPGYKLIRFSLSPSRVTITGAESEVQEVGEATTDLIPLEGRKEGFSGVVNIAVAHPNVSIIGQRTTQVSVEIGEANVEMTLADIPISFSSQIYLTMAEPSTVSVTIKAPSEILRQINTERIIATINVAGLQPRLQPYILSPKVSFDPSLADAIELIAVAPDKVEVRVYAERVAKEGVS